MKQEIKDALYRVLERAQLDLEHDDWEGYEDDREELLKAVKIVDKWLESEMEENIDPYHFFDEKGRFPEVEE